MSTLDNRQFVAFSIGQRSGLMFYVSCDATTQGDYRVFIGNQHPDDELVTVLPRRGLTQEHGSCRCPDDDCSHKSTYYVLYKGREIKIDMRKNCTQLDPSGYVIEEVEHGVVITKRLSAGGL